MLRSNIIIKEGQALKVQVEGREGYVWIGYPHVGDPMITVNTTDNLNQEEGFLLTRVRIEPDLLDT